MDAHRTFDAMGRPSERLPVPALIVSGPHGAPYAAGDSMHLSCVNGPLGVLKPTFSDGPIGRVMHIDRFEPTKLVLGDERNLGRWMLYEICAFMVKELPDIRVLHFTLSRPLDCAGSSSKQVLTRLAALDRIGAEGIRLTQRPVPVHVIEGFWRPTPTNQMSLGGALVEHRAELRLRPPQALIKPSKLGSALRGRLDSLRRFLAG